MKVGGFEIKVGFEITEPTELLIFISLVSLATFPLSKYIIYLLYITHMIHSNPPSVQSKQRTGRCFDVTVVLRHRREILHFKINELKKKTLEFCDSGSLFLWQAIFHILVPIHIHMRLVLRLLHRRNEILGFDLK